MPYIILTRVTTLPMSLVGQWWNSAGTFPLSCSPPQFVRRTEGNRQNSGEVLSPVSRRVLSKKCWEKPDLDPKQLNLVSHGVLLSSEWTHWLSKGVVYGCLMPIKCAYLDRRSNTTSTVSTPWDRGSPSTKSKEMSSHTLVGVGKGWSKPAGHNKLC